MALVKCKECGNEISKKATQCPKCGSPQKKKTSLFTWIVTIIAGIVFYNILSSGGDSVGLVDLNDYYRKNWDYKRSNDSMSGKTIYNAIVDSANVVEFDFPYQGKQRATLTMRTHPKYGKDVILSVEKGQFLCGIQGCKVSVSFDGENATSYSAAEPSDHSTESLFIKNYSQFASKVLKSSKVKIQAEFFQEGTRTFKFDVSGFNVQRYRPDAE